MLTIVVNTTVDGSHAAGLISLRDAITTANISTSATTITFDPKVFATAQTITLDGSYLDLSSAQAVTIVGSTAGVTISGNNLSRDLWITAGSTVSISDVTFTGGYSGPGYNGFAGSIYNGGKLTLTGCSIINNNAGADGGGILSVNTVLTMIDCTVSGNTSGGGRGHGGGALNVSGSLILEDDTIVGNTAVDNGGGIYDTNASISIANTIIAGNTSQEIGNDVDGSINSLGNNLIGITNGSSGWRGSDRTGTIATPLSPKLGPLANNGGPTKTLMPVAGSPAIDTGSNSLIPSGITTDQRGFARIVNGTVDIGAVEVQLPHMVFHTQPTTETAGKAITPSVVVYIENENNQIIKTDESTVRISRGAGTGALSGTVAIAAVNGIATFSNLIFTVAGSGYTLKATDSTDVSAISNAFNVSPAAASKLVFAAPPTSGPAGASLNPPVVVYIEDAYGNIVRNITSVVTMSVASGPGTISGTASVALNNGAAVFNNIWFQTPGAYMVTAKDGALAPITSGSFTEAAGVFHLVFASPPKNATAGAKLNPSVVVYVMDAGGNIIRNIKSPVTLSVKIGPGAISGTASVALNNGAAVFSNAIFTKAGAYTIIAQDGPIGSIISGSFTIAPAAENKLVFTTLPTTAKHAVAFTVKVSVEDIYGNVLTSQNTGTITLALATHPTGSTLGGTLTANVVKGVATFSNLTVSLAGTYTLEASDSFAIAAVSSASIVVS